MQELTPPADRLPEGCGLKSLEPVPQTYQPPGARVRIVQPGQSMHPPNVIANPWIGSERLNLAWLRRRVDGFEPLRVPDAPPMMPAEDLAFFEQLADGISEGYAATYVQRWAPDLGVHAVRSSAGAEARAVFLQRSRGRRVSKRFTFGDVRVVLYGDAGECSTAIETHLRSLSR
jgi:hypothetical protein